MNSGASVHRAGVAAAFLAVLLCGVVVASGAPARGAGSVEVTSSGPARVITGTDEPTGRVVATFSITDPTMTATGATICRTYAGGRPQGCRYQRFDGAPTLDESDPYVDDYSFEDDDDEYSRWEITGQVGSWSVAYPIGFDVIDRKQCLSATWQDKPFSALIDVKNDAGAVLASGSWTYEVLCTGIEGVASGPERTRVYAGRATTSKPMNFFALDTREQLSSFRACRYSSISERYFGCDREALTSKHRLKDGTWGVQYSITWQPLGSSTCSYVGRKWPQEGMRVQFYDSSMRLKLSLYWGTRVDC